MVLNRYVLWLWLLSGVPVGVALWYMPPAGRVLCFGIFILLDTMHTLSPIALAWSNTGFRCLMLGQARKFLVLPGAIFVVGAVVSIVTAMGWTAYVPGPNRLYRATGWDNPFPIMFGAYFAWNFYHFSMQNYGVLRLCGFDLGRWGKIAAFAVTAIGIKTMPLAVSVNHWVTDIGLSCRASRRGLLFVAGLLTVAPVAFLWNVPVAQGMALRSAEGVVVALYGVRLSTGFVHFLYSRWIWRLSDPRVRVTIGKELFA